MSHFTFIKELSQLLLVHHPYFDLLSICLIRLFICSSYQREAFGVQLRQPPVVGFLYWLSCFRFRRYRAGAVVRLVASLAQSRSYPLGVLMFARDLIIIKTSLFYFVPPYAIFSYLAPEQGLEEVQRG